MPIAQGGADLDAIGVDQNNTAETMDHLYKNADMVIVWLGVVPSPDFLRVERGGVTLKVDDIDWDKLMEDIATWSH